MRTANVVILLSALLVTTPGKAPGASYSFSDRAAFLAATSSTQVVTFEGLLPSNPPPQWHPVPDGDPALLGVAFHIASAHCVGNWGPSRLGLDYDLAGVFLTDTFGDAPCETLVVTLPSKVSAFGFDFGSRGGFSYEFPPRIILSNGFTTDVAVARGFIGFTSDEPFVDARIVNPHYGWNINMELDNVTFGDRAVLRADIDVDPDVLNTKSRGRWVSAYLALPGHDPTTVDVSSVRISGLPAVSEPLEAGDHDGDGVPDVGLKVDRASLVENLPIGMNRITVSGRLTTGESFEGEGWVRVIAPGLAAGLAGQPDFRIGSDGVLHFTTGRTGPVQMELFDVRGRLALSIARESVPEGRQAWSLTQGKRLTSGIYFYRMTTIEGRSAGRVIVLR